MSAEGIAQALGGRKAGATWLACCPAHDDREPSLSLRDSRDGKVLVRCHAGCEQTAVIGALRSLGLWERARAAGLQAARRPSAPVRDEPDPDGARRTELALALWRAAKPPEGTLVETYLASRSLRLPSTLSTIRFHPGLKHPAGATWPAMIALVTRGTDDTPLAVHRTFLAHDGAGKAPVKPQKMMLGPTRGGTVRLAPVASKLMVGEGIETALSAMQVTGTPAWAALSTSGLRSLVLPDAVEEVVILVDADPPGEAAARDTAARLLRQGREVWIARPTRDCKDFNDLLRGGICPGSSI